MGALSNLRHFQEPGLATAIFDAAMLRASCACFFSHKPGHSDEDLISGSAPIARLIL